MTKRSWLSELAHKTGEQRRTLSNRGFSLVKISARASDGSGTDYHIRTINWDRHEAARGLSLRPMGRS
jgi:hypothetical protein